tara:strand:- start:16 stop:510 length:495 start_codon:yes stop_codon:yes gene_type:complete
MIIRNWNYFLFLISSVAILSALIAEYIYNLQPCELCLKQRHPYYLFIVISLLILSISNFKKLFGYILIQLGTIYGIFYSIWHVGVENKILKGPANCSANLSISSNTTDLKQQILNKQVISCDEVVWSFFGISAASLNTIVLLFIFVINGLYIYKYYGKKEKNQI